MKWKKNGKEILILPFRQNRQSFFFALSPSSAHGRLTMTMEQKEEKIKLFARGYPFPSNVFRLLLQSLDPLKSPDLFASLFSLSFSASTHSHSSLLCFFLIKFFSEQICTGNLFALVPCYTIFWYAEFFFRILFFFALLFSLGALQPTSTV